MKRGSGVAGTPARPCGSLSRTGNRKRETGNWKLTWISGLAEDEEASGPAVGQRGSFVRLHDEMVGAVGQGPAQGIHEMQVQGMESSAAQGSKARVPDPAVGRAEDHEPD